MRTHVHVRMKTGLNITDKTKSKKGDNKTLKDRKNKE